MNIVFNYMRFKSSIKIILALCVFIFINHSLIYANFNEESEIKNKIEEFISELLIDINNRDLKGIIDKYYKDGISSSEFGKRSKHEIEKALNNNKAPLTQFMFGKPSASYYNNCVNSEYRIYTTPKHFYEVYGNEYDIEIVFRGLNKRNLPEYRVEVNGNPISINGIQCSLKLPSIYVVIENEKVYLASIIYIIRKGLPGSN